ncbi:MAG: NAD-dependent deacylase [Bacteroidetes bacterium]|nr:NAD-dependent deacylase [Bacteroidota bacterium]
MKEKIKEAALLLKNSNYTIVFTGAGISVESGIPPFRGENGLWNTYDPSFLEISQFLNYPIESWKLVKEVFYDFFGQAKPNKAHIAIAEMEKQGIINRVITQNIDNLHTEAGSQAVLEFHGNSRELVCTNCPKRYTKDIVVQQEIPLCDDCHSLLKPDFVFYGEAIPEPTGSQSFSEGMKAEVMLIIGTTGEVMPACNIPYYAKRNKAKIIEINPIKSNYTDQITDIFLAGKATEIMISLQDEISLL